MKSKICILISILSQITFASNLTLNLDGDGDCLNLPQIPQLTSYSISFWFSPSTTRDSSAATRHMLYEANGPQPDTYIQLFDDGKLRYRTFVTPINNLYSVTDKWIGGAWYHVAATWDSTSRVKNLYINGIEQSSDTLAIDLALNTENAHMLGRYSADQNQYFNGRIDEVRIWEYARPLEAILVDMHQTLTGSETGLVACWNFDDGTANDATANGFDAALMDDAFIAASDRADIEFSVLKLDGDGDYISLPQVPSQSSYSVSMWFSPSVTRDSSTADRQVLYEATGPKPDTYIQFFDGGALRYRTFITPINNLCSATEQWIADAWYHLAVTYDSSSHIKNLYLNGIEKTSDTLTIDLALNTEYAHTLGRYSLDQSQYFHGRIDAVNIWEYARPQEEILLAMHQTLTGLETGLMACWNFDDGTADDRTGNGYDGTLMGDAQIISRFPVSVNQASRQLPGRFLLEQNYPNPFNPTTRIRYQLAEPSRVTLQICNLLGQTVKSLVDKNQMAGDYTILWDACNDDGQRVASGIYLYRLCVDDLIQTRKMVLMQ